MTRRLRPAPQQERNIPDSDIKKLDFLFPPEVAAAAPDQSSKVQWPKYVRVQRQRVILAKRLRIPPPINQFRFTLNKDEAVRLFSFLERCKPPAKKAKQASLKKAAAESERSLAPTVTHTAKALGFGIRDVTQLVESKRAQLVVIAHDVNPIEIVVWLPALCRRMGVPYVIVKGKARLGKVVGMNTTSCIAIREVKVEDKRELAQILDSVQANFTQLYQDELGKWGGAELSQETIEKLRKQGKLRE
jgi:large subunit ribosomal protein L7Ae